jgi:hypothetical protein
MRGMPLVPVLRCCELLPAVSSIGDFLACLDSCNSLKTKNVRLECRLHFTLASFKENAVIVFALLGAILLLVGVSVVSSIDFSNDQRR